MKRAYQILIVNRVCGINAIIPDKYCYDNLSQALVDITAREQVFLNAGEPFEYKGVISGLDAIAEICKKHDLTVDTNEAYIYELEVKTKFDGK